MNIWQAFKMAFKSISMKKTRSFLTIAGAINGADYLKEGRTLQNLGLGGLTPETLSARLSDPTSAPAA